jgi:hypothetical protein
MKGLLHAFIQIAMLGFAFCYLVASGQTKVDAIFTLLIWCIALYCLMKRYAKLSKRPKSSENKESD